MGLNDINKIIKITKKQSYIFKRYGVVLIIIIIIIIIIKILNAWPN